MCDAMCSCWTPCKVSSRPPFEWVGGGWYRVLAQRGPAPHAAAAAAAPAADRDHTLRANSVLDA